MTINIETLLTNPTAFSIYVETESKKMKTTLFDILLNMCEKHNIEFDSLSKMMSTSLKQKLHAEALELNLLKEKKLKNQMEQFYE